MDVYTIRHKPSGGFLPEIAGTRGYTHTEPVTHLPPRLFVAARDAQVALTWWLKGITSVTRGWTEIAFEGREYDESWHLQEMPNRKADDMEIVHMYLKELRDGRGA